MKILVRGTNWIGDAVMSVPALRELRRIFPDAHIALHTRNLTAGIFQDVDFIDELVTFDPSKWRAKDVYDNSQFLRDDGFELAILLPNSFESALTTFLSRIPRRFGYNKDVRGLLLTDPIAVPEWKNRRHEVFYYLNLISEVEKRVIGTQTVTQVYADSTIEVSDDRKTAAAARLGRSGVKHGRLNVALGVGSTNSNAKRWPADRYAKLCNKLQAELAANVIIVGSKGDAPVAAEVISESLLEPINLTGETSIEEAAAILSVVDLFITNDMGLAHLAPAVGTPTIVIFGPTNPETTRPFSDLAFILRHDVECSPCMLRECPIDHRCMTGISVDAVFEKARLILSAADSGGNRENADKIVVAETTYLI